MSEELDVEVLERRVASFDRGLLLILRGRVKWEVVVLHLAVDERNARADAVTELVQARLQEDKTLRQANRIDLGLHC